MSLFGFLFEAVLISLSGGMAPGPMTTMAVGKGSESPHAGALVAAGHAVVEIPVMVAVFYGTGRLLDLPHVQAVIALVGGVFLLVMGTGMIRGAKKEVSATTHRTPAVLAGVLVSVGNPYFLVWWATVGAALIMRSVRYGLLGFVSFALLHSLCDLLWSWFLSALSFKGRQFFGQRFQRWIFVACGVLLLFFGGKLMGDGAMQLSAQSMF